MPALQVREMPDDLYERLKFSAKVNHRSLAQETISMLESCLNPDINNSPIKESLIENNNGFRATREYVFAQLDQINSKEHKISSTTIEKICLQSKDELDKRFCFAALQYQVN